MTWLRRLRARIRYRRFDHELQRELEVHRAMAEDALRVRDGAPGDARREVARQLGNVALAREASRAVWIAPWLEGVWQDLRYAGRTLRRQPGFALTATATLTLGIGLNTALFTAFNAFYLQPWPAADPDRVVLVSHRSSGSSESRMFSPEEAAHISDHATSFSHLAAFGGAWPTRIGVAAAGEIPDVFVGVVSSSFFDVLSRPMAMGRGFQRDDEQSGGPRVAIISHGTWHRRFGGARDVIGRTLYVDGDTPFTVIGVAARGIHAPAPHQHEAWVLPSSFDRLRNGPVTLVGRLARGVDPHTAEAELTTLLGQVHAASRAGETRGVEVTSTVRGLSGRSPQLVAAGLIQVALAIVLCLACLNVANLQLARALARRPEIALRLSLGAGRARIVRQLVTEAALLAGLAAAGAFAVVYVAARAIHHYAAPELIRQPWTPDATVLLFTCVIGLLCTLVFGLVPALQSTRRLRPSFTTIAAGGPARMRFRSVLLAAQIALSALLIVSASLLTRAIGHAASSDSDFDLHGVTIGRVTVPAGWTPDAVLSFKAGLQAALERSSLRPVGFVDHEPLERVQFVGRFHTPAQGDGDARTVRIQAMSAESLGVLRLSLAAGRAYDDRPGSSEVAVNETLARRFWPSGDVLGQTLVEGDRRYTVVGVVRDARFAAFESMRPIEPTLYRAASPRTLTMIVRAAPQEARGELDAIVRALDTRAAADVVPLSDNVHRALANEVLAARIAWGVGTLGLVLATVGVFGLFGYMVEAQRREIGIRLALGARRRQVLASVFARVQWAIGGGLATGLLLSLGAGALLQRQLFGLSLIDPLAYVGALAILLAAAVLATFIPARRAIRIDPAVTLRAE